MAIPDRLENKEAIEAAKAEILAAIAQTDGKLDAGITVKSVKSIQKGAIYIDSGSTSGTSRINAVDINKSAVFHNGNYTVNDGNDGDGYICTLELTDSTTVTAKKQQTINSLHQLVAFTVIEFY